MTTTLAQWDNTSVSTASVAKNGGFVEVVLGVDHSYAGGANAATTLSNIICSYDEQ